MHEGVVEVHEQHVRRLAGIDPLVRVGRLDLAGEGSVEWAADGQAVAVVDVRDTDPGSEAGLWGDDRVVRVQLRAASDEAASATTELLRRAHRPETGAGMTHVSVAARDTALIRPLGRAGFAPNSVLAVHRLSRADVRPPESSAEVVVRVAEASDLDAVVAAHVAVQAFDAHIGSLPERPGAEQVMRPLAEQALRDRPGWNWVAERDGSILGVCQMEPPDDAQWVADQVTSPVAAYLGLLHVDPAARGLGVGSRLVAAAHLRAVAAGAQVVLLHHAAANPLSAPFWGRAGYRPLVTGWARRA